MKVIIKKTIYRLKEKAKGSFLAESIKRFFLIYRFLGKRHRRFLIYLQISSFINDFLITLLVAGISLFVILLSQPSLMLTNPYLNKLYTFSGLSEQQFLILAAFAAVLSIVFRAVYNLWQSWFSLKVMQSINLTCSAQLYYYYITRDYTDFMGEKVDYISNVTNMVAGNINNNINFVFLISLFVNTVIVISLLLAYEFLFGFILLVSVVLFYFTFLRLFKEKLYAYGKRSVAIDTEKYKLIHEGTAGLVEFLMSGKERILGQVMNKRLIEMQDINLRSTMINVIPEHIIKITSGLFMFFVIFYFIYYKEVDNYIEPLIVFLMGGMRLNAAISQIYNLVLSLSQTHHGFYVVMNDLNRAKSVGLEFLQPREALPAQRYKRLRFKNVSYTYPGSSVAAISDLNFSLPQGKVTILCGYSGSGKSTVARLLGCLLVPQQGEIMLDDQALTSIEAKRRWQLSIAYVTQKPFFIGASLAANIAFAYFEDDVIDNDRLLDAVKKAELEDFVKGLPEGLDTQIGQSAMRLSGGEGQRILVARALYKRASLFIFDEATSALDKYTERKIMNTILSTSSGKSVLVISHEPDIFDASDQVIFLKEGKIEALGPYQTLLRNNAEFKEFVGNPEPRRSA